MLNCFRKLKVLCVLLLATASVPLLAAESIRVGIKEAAPFSFQNDAGEWTGIAVDLWERIAEDNGFDYSYVVYDLGPMLNALEVEEVDVAVSALTITAERETRFDFTHPFLDTGLAIATEVVPAGWLYTAKRFVSLEFIAALTALAGVVGGFGVIMWWVERKRNEQFGGSALKGVGNGFWWSAVTMTTVGYGDKAPVTFAGRVVGLIWMFAAIIIISGFTAAIASSLTVGSLRTKISGVDDLDSVRVGAISDSTAAQYLEEKSIRHKKYVSMDALLTALDGSELDAVLHDAPILQYELNQRGMEAYELLEQLIEPQAYGIGLKTDFEQREAINRSLLELTEQRIWEEIQARYISSD